MPPTSGLSRADLQFAVRIIHLKRMGHAITLPPPQKLFDSIEEAHELFLEQVAWSLRVGRELGLYMGEEEFLRTVMDAWKLWLRYCPKG